MSDDAELPKRVLDFVERQIHSVAELEALLLIRSEPGERWDVREERIKPLLDRAFITPEQADKFRVEGALGSHLENLERNDGFKGFNQEGVSDIIARTDPRRQGAVAKAH